MAVEIRRFRAEDTNPVLELANIHAAFDGTMAEADLAPASYFPDGFWVAEDGGKIVGYLRILQGHSIASLAEVEGEQGGPPRPDGG